MGNKNPKNKFKPGNKGGGRKALPEDIKAARSQSYEDMCRTVIEVCSLTPADIKKLDLDKLPLGKRAIINAYAKLDYRGIKDYEDRLWGKAKESVGIEIADMPDLEKAARETMEFFKKLHGKTNRGTE